MSYRSNTERVLCPVTYVQARGWNACEYVDRGVSGIKDRRPELDRLVADAKRRRIDTLVVWKLDRLGRSLKHLIMLLDELQSLGVGFVSLGESIDTSTPAGRLQLHLLAAVAQFEQERIVERDKAGLERARTEGKRLGRPRAPLPLGRLQSVTSLSLTEAASALGVSRATIKRWRKAQKTHSPAA
jgi:DNA invertase Pin-like site-specific DNA recombinase